MKWVKHPLILEINTLPWLHHLSEKFQEDITLQNIPDSVILDFENYNAIWLMGVWQRSKISEKIAQEHKELQDDFQQGLPDYTPADIIGSPYAVKNYEPDPRIGGNNGLHNIHKCLNDLEKCLILDYIPNHTAIDHPWVANNPDIYIKGSFSAHLQNPGLFEKIGGNLYAHGKDPYFSPWTDTLQLNAFSEKCRKQSLETLLKIQKKCDGVRCDMAMLPVNSVFLKTWGQFVEERPNSEYWDEIIPHIKSKNPEFKFIAEVYWDMEWELMQQGCDYCYDKTLYDRMLYDPARAVRGHLQAEWEYSSKLVRFIENHDEKRAITAFGSDESTAAACISLCLPGARLIHYGQQLGFTRKLPVQLGRWSQESENPNIREFYKNLTSIIKGYLIESNLWNLGRVYKQDTPGPENPIISYYWNLNKLIIYVIVNFSSNDVNCVLDLSTHRQDISYNISSLLQHNSETTEFIIQNSQIPLKFGPWGFQILKFSY